MEWLRSQTGVSGLGSGSFRTPPAAAGKNVVVCEIQLDQHEEDGHEMPEELPERGGAEGSETPKGEHGTSKRRLIPTRLLKVSYTSIGRFDLCLPPRKMDSNVSCSRILSAWLIEWTGQYRRRYTPRYSYNTQFDVSETRNSHPAKDGGTTARLSSGCGSLGEMETNYLFKKY